MPEDVTSPRSRDRLGTEAALVRAAREVLSADGFQALGVNAVARAAGCDKQLIYRYFGGLDGLVDAVGAEIADDLRAALEPLSALGRPSSYRELVERMLLGFLQALRADPLMQKIMVWEIASPSPQVQRLTMARSRSMLAWIMATRGDLAPPAGIDAPAANALLIAGIQHLVLSGAAAGQFSGVPLATDADWERVRALVKSLVAAVYGQGA